jgi:hypothetical protein
MTTVSIRFDAVEFVNVSALLALTLIRVEAEGTTAIIEVWFLLCETL